MSDTILKEEEYARWPLWAGILAEASDGMLGSVGEMLVAQLLKETLDAGHGEGLWRDSWWEDGVDLYEQLDSISATGVSST